jgi:hypothetical protein
MKQTILSKTANQTSPSELNEDTIHNYPKGDKFKNPFTIHSSTVVTNSPKNGDHKRFENVYPKL